MRPDKAMGERSKMRQEIGNRAAREVEGGMRRIRVGETAGAENVEADQDLDVRDPAELAGIDQLEGSLRCFVEDVIVVLDEVAAALTGLLTQHFQFFQGRGGRLL